MTNFEPNLSAFERGLALALGATMTTAAVRSSGRLRYGLIAAGIGLVGRGITGFCPVNAAVGRNTATRDTREALGDRRGINVQAATTIYRPVEEVYGFWRRFENLPRFMRHLQEVREIDDARSWWSARAPLGASVEWEAEIINDIPNQLIAWRSLESADVVSAGSVRFHTVRAGRGVEVLVNLQYEPPAGKLGAAVARLLGAEPSRQIREDLRRFKQLLEAGEIPTGARYRDRSNPQQSNDIEVAPVLADATGGIL